MTSKNKAEELINSFLHVQDDNYGIDYAKLCAFRCVDEIINCDSFFKTLEDTKEFTKYWYEVQEEIKLL